MGENYLDMVPVIVIFFALGILISTKHQMSENM